MSRFECQNIMIIGTYPLSKSLRTHFGPLKIRMFTQPSLGIDYMHIMEVFFLTTCGYCSRRFLIDSEGNLLLYLILSKLNRQWDI